MRSFAAVDLGASSGRVMRAIVAPRGVELREVHRFPNEPVRVRGTLYWDVLSLWSGVLEGLRIAGQDGDLAGIGFDSWAVDYALLDADGGLFGLPVHYRDSRTNGVPSLVDGLIRRTNSTPQPVSTGSPSTRSISSSPRAIRMPCGTRPQL